MAEHVKTQENGFFVFAFKPNQAWVSNLKQNLQKRIDSKLGCSGFEDMRFLPVQVLFVNSTLLPFPTQVLRLEVTKVGHLDVRAIGVVVLVGREADERRAGQRQDCEKRNAHGVPVIQFICSKRRKSAVTFRFSNME